MSIIDQTDSKAKDIVKNKYVYIGTWKNLENLKGDGVGGGFDAELWFPLVASLAILLEFLKTKQFSSNKLFQIPHH